MHSLSRSSISAAATAILSLPCPAQGSGFQSGELVLFSPAVQGSHSQAGAIVRIDPLTGDASLLLDLVTTPHSYQGIAYDPYRERLIFVGGFPTAGDPRRLHLMDGFGNTTSLGFDDATISAFAPASGGRIYVRMQNAPVIRYLDAQDVMRPLLDAGGTQAFVPPHHDVRAMAFDAGTNSLFVAAASNSLWNCGAPSIDVTVTRLELSANGTHVTGASSCVEVTVDPSSAGTPVGLSRGPGGKLLLVVDNNTNASGPRMQLIDPVTLDATPYASNGYLGAAATNGGTWSSIRGEVVILDTFSDALRAFGFGEVGEGTIVTPSIQISSPGGTGETATLIEIRPGGCSSGVGQYCQAKMTAAGCLPAIATAGAPSATAGSGFTITASDLTPHQFGVFFYGLNVAASVPFQGGFLCVQPAVVRTPPVNSGGAGPCSGVLSIDFNAYVAGGVDAQLVAGAVVHGQFWFRDPAHPVAGTGLTGGVTFTICP